MKYRLFPSEAEAIAAEAKASDNVRRLARIVAPKRVADDGALLGINAATWQVEPLAGKTQRWAIPSQVATGWVIPVPSEDEIAPVPLSVFLLGVGGEEIDLIAPPLPSPDPTLQELAR